MHLADLVVRKRPQRGAREELGRVESAGQQLRLVAAAARSLVVAGERVATRGVEQHRRARLRVDPKRRRAQHALEQRGRVFVGELRLGLLCRAARDLECALRHRQRRRFEQVVRDSGVGCIRRVAVAIEQRLGERGVMVEPLGRSQRRGQHLGEERVHEAEQAGVLRMLLDQRHAARLAERRHQARQLGVERSRHELRPEVAAQERRAREHPAALG